MSTTPMTEIGRAALRRWAERDVAGEAGALDEVGEDVIRLLDERDALAAEYMMLRRAQGRP